MKLLARFRRLWKRSVCDRMGCLPEWSHTRSLQGGVVLYYRCERCGKITEKQYSVSSAG